MEAKTTMPPKAPKAGRWRDEYLVDAYLLATTGATDMAIGLALGGGERTMERWVAEKPALVYALAKGREKKIQTPGTFVEYVYARLSPPMRALWDRVQWWGDHEDEYAKVDAILAPQGPKVRQHLWLHAMVVTNFNASEANAMVGVTKRVLDQWQREDVDFPELVAELEYHKKNFFEDALIGLVSMGVFPAVIHANKTLNRDRGYGDRMEVNHTHQHTHNVLNLDKLKLSLACRLEIREAMRLYQDARPVELADTPVAALALAEGT